MESSQRFDLAQAIEQGRKELAGVNIWNIVLPNPRVKNNGVWENKVSPELFPRAKNRIELFFSLRGMATRGDQTATGFRIEITDDLAQDLLNFVNISGARIVKENLNRTQRRILHV